MQAKGLFGKKYLDIQERVREIPTLAEDFVLVKVRACGVCGTDINFVRDWDDDPMPLGHEISAEVVEVGKERDDGEAGRQRYCRGLHDVRCVCGVQERSAAVLPQHVRHGRSAGDG